MPAPTIDIGSLNRLCTIEKNVQGRNEYGEPVASWTFAGTRWASIRPLVGSEKLEAAQVDARINVRIRMRYFEGLHPKDRIRYESRTFEIVSVADLQDAREVMVIDCVEDL